MLLLYAGGEDFSVNMVYVGALESSLVSSHLGNGVLWLD